MSFKLNRKKTVCDCGETYLEHKLPEKPRRIDVVQMCKDTAKHNTESLMHRKYAMMSEKKLQVMSFNRKETVCDCGETYLDMVKHNTESLMHRKYAMMMSFKLNRKQTVCDCGEAYLEHVLPKKPERIDVLQMRKDMDKHTTESLTHRKYAMMREKKYGFPKGLVEDLVKKANEPHNRLTKKSAKVVHDK